jgi:hypothetical protein
MKQHNPQPLHALLLHCKHGHDLVYISGEFRRLT